MRKLIQRLLFVGLLVSPALCSYCGKTAVPYSFEVLPNGAPVLGCAQPSCVAAIEEPLTEDSEFLTDVTGQSDGFFRDGDRALKRYRHDSAPKLIANCSGQFNELSCPRKNQFVGGIEYIDHPRQPLILQCCTYDGLRFSQEVGTTTVGPGEAITGGEVVRGGRQISFDVIANVRKIVRSTSSQRVSYEVTVRRMNCLPDPPEPEVSFDQAVPAEVLKVLSSATAKEVGSTENHEAKLNTKDGKKEPKQFASATEQVAESNANKNSVVSLSPNNPLPASVQPIQQQVNQQVNQQPVYQPQQAVYQPQQAVYQPQPQQYIDPNQQVAAAAPETSTVFPTLPTLFPTHSFPTIAPHTFPTHSFPTFPPHTFPTHSFTFPPLTATASPVGFGAPASSGFGSAQSGVAFGVPAGSQGAANPLPTLAPFTPHTFPPFSPLPVLGASTPGFPQPVYGQQQDGSAASQFGQQQVAQPQYGQSQAPQAQQYYSAQNQPQSPTSAMGTILQNFHGNYRPIELPGLGVVGYSNSS